MDTTVVENPPYYVRFSKISANFASWQQNLTNEAFLGHDKLDVDQLWVVESTEHIFEGNRDVPVRLGGRKTWFSSKNMSLLLQSSKDLSKKVNFNHYSYSIL